MNNIRTQQFLAPRHSCAVLLLLLLGACTVLPNGPDLSHLYAVASGGRPPVVLIHGVLGAKLRELEGGREVWPGGLIRLTFSEYHDLALPIDPETLQPEDDDIEPYALFDRAVGRDFYGAIVRTLEDAGGYQRAEPGQLPDAPRVYYVFLYDWRRDNIESVRRLDELIERVRADHNDPTLRVDLVAHSNGGLIARYFARYGTHDVLDGDSSPINQTGAAKIRRLILFGTPNFGSLASLKGFIEGAPVGFNRILPEVLLTMPSAYQLFPHALNRWLIDINGATLHRNLFDVDTWRRFQWAIFDPKVRTRIAAEFDDPIAAQGHLNLLERYFERHLERGRRFTWALSVSEPMPVRPIVLGGDCNLTPARLLMEEVGAESVLRLWPRDIELPLPGIDYERLMLEPGDGTVTKASLLAREMLDPSVPRNPDSHFVYDYAFFLCERHDRLTGNLSFQDNLLHALLSVDR